MMLIRALASAAALAVSLPAAADPAPVSIEDWRRAMACEAHVGKLADEDERGYRSFVAAARRDPSLRAQADGMARSEPANIALKRQIATAARSRADAALSASYASWRTADPQLPSADALVRQETLSARAAAARWRNVAQLSTAIDRLSCEDFLVQ